jgi:hypothetical protein
MSRHTHDADCTPYALERLAVAAERISDTLDDAIDMMLVVQQIASVAKTHDPDVAAALRPVTDAIEKIVDRRAAREIDVLFS